MYPNIFICNFYILNILGGITYMSKIKNIIKRLLKTKFKTIEVDKDYLFERHKKSYHNVVYAELINTKCLFGPKHDGGVPVFYKEHLITFYMHDCVTYYITIGGSDFIVRYDLDKKMDVEDICKMLDNLINTHKYGTGYAFIRTIILSAGVREEDLIEMDGSAIDIKLSSGKYMTIHPRENMTNAGIKLLYHLIKINY